MNVSVQRADRIGVFCGARPGTRAAYLEAAWEFGTALAARNLGLVYGAGGIGIMGSVAKATLAGGGTVTGVIPQDLFDREKPEPGHGELFVVRSMHERKALMYRLSSAFAVLPGGFGTLDELMEVSTWNQLGFHRKPVVLVNEAGFFDPLTALLDNIVAEGFMSPADRALIQVAGNATEALALLLELRTMAEPPEAGGGVAGAPRTRPAPQLSPA
ncbi:TIGR00730 family Rossman fold protein [Streptomyces sp. NPDC051020]|uniref:LOG family protein n=1 Tax=Streptomyces sp. NPDC051020 TaxID=3155409 RepID=UPI00342D4361